MQPLLARLYFGEEAGRAVDAALNFLGALKAGSDLDARMRTELLGQYKTQLDSGMDFERLLSNSQTELMKHLRPHLANYAEIIERVIRALGAVLLGAPGTPGRR